MDHFIEDLNEDDIDDVEDRTNTILTQNLIGLGLL